MKKIIPKIFFFVFCFPLYLLSQPSGLSFDRISTEEGLSQSFVHCLFKDETGYVWAGTQDGLNRFDGYQFKNYFHDPSDSSSLSNNYVWDIIQGANSNIWIGTNGGGLCRYDPVLDQFYTFYNDAKTSNATGQNSVRSIFKTQSGDLLVGTDSGLYFFDIKLQKFEKVNPSGSNQDFVKSIFYFERISNDLILAGSIGELFFYNEKDKSLSSARLSSKIEGGFHCFTKLENNKFWAGTGKGLLQLKWISQSDSLLILKQYTAEDKTSHPISSNFISSLTLDEEGRLWMATDDGLNYLNTKTEIAEFFHFKNKPAEDNSLSNNLVYDLLEVEKGIIWAATQQGINQFSAKSPLLNAFDLENIESFICGNSIHGMLEEDSGDLLFCTDKGLVQVSGRLDDKTTKLVCLDNKYFPELEDEFLVSIRQGNHNAYWLALRRGGFARLQRDDNGLVLESYKLPAGAYSNLGTNSLVERDNGDLWIASSGIGLWKLDQNTNEYTSFAKNEKDSLSISGNYIFHLFEDHENFLWVATADGGLCRMDPNSETFDCFTHDETNAESISSNMILSVFEDSQNRIWACTANGLNLLSEDGKFIRFYKKDGLPNNLIYGMLEDEQGNLWVSTNQGLSKIRYENNKLLTKNYTRQNGLLNNEFNQHAFLKLKNGQLVFGTKGGVNYFDPNQIRNYEVHPQLVFTEFKLFNEPVPVNAPKASATFSLKKHINALDEMVLPYNKNFIAFEFSGINFEQASTNQYAYQMEGLDEDWVYCGSRKFANYPGLVPGDYTFKVKAANHDGVWNPIPKSLKIRVLSPPWKTWWAYLIYLFSGFALVYSLFKYRLYNIRKIEQAKHEERTVFRKRSAQDFHDEAGNQITKISLMTEIAKRKADEDLELNDLLTQIGDNVQVLRSGMRDFIWVLDPGNDNLYETLLRLKEFANGNFEYSPIHFTTSGIDEGLKNLSLNSNERRHLLLIFKEAINNCLKYSTAKNAWFVVRKREKSFELIFSDDGKGYDVESKSNGYGLQNMQSRAKKINGELNIISKKGEGTTVSFFLNTTQMGH